MIYATVFASVPSPPLEPSLNSKLSLLNVTHYIFIIKTSSRKNKLYAACVPETALSVTLGQNIRGGHSGNE